MQLVRDADLRSDATIRCAITGLRVLPSECELIHLVPLKGEGTHTIDNVRFAHREINRMMGQMTYAKFLEMCRLVVATADSQ